MVDKILTSSEITSGSTERRVRADTVVLLIGNKSEDSLHKNLKGKVKEVFAVGDYVAPGKP